MASHDILGGLVQVYNLEVARSNRVPATSLYLVEAQYLA